jgi:phosphoribosylamine--glycine ligase
VDLTIVGPEVPLAGGIADTFRNQGLNIFGPTRDAAMIESSKTFAKDLMRRHGVPTAKAESFASYEAARRHLVSRDFPVVVKADGLTAGKGVTVAQTEAEAVRALSGLMIEKQLGVAGERVLIEDCLEGQEVSVFAFVVGSYVSTMVAACDYKRVGDGDQGPNTGGMGSFSPPPFWTQDLDDRVRAEIMEPVALALATEGRPYSGVLYAGLMLTSEGPMVIEFNCRMGDPETQAILPRLKTDLAELMAGTVASGDSTATVGASSMSGWPKLQDIAIDWAPSSCVGVVLASGGYPGHYETGHPIDGLSDLDADVTAFHAGTRLGTESAGLADTVVTNGGRVLTISACGDTLKEARERAYANVERVKFKDSFYRRDIAAYA